MPQATPKAPSATADPSLRRAAALVSALGGSLPPGLLDAMPGAQRRVLEQAVKQISASPADERRALLRELATGCRAAATRGTKGPGVPAPRRAAAGPGEDTRPLQVPAEAPLGWTARVPVELLTAALERERPQAAAVVVAHAPRQVAEALVAGLPSGVAQEVAWAITRTGPPAPGALQALDAALSEEVTRLQEREARRCEGVRSLARSLAKAPADLARGALLALEARDPSLARAVAQVLPPLECDGDDEGVAAEAASGEAEARRGGAAPLRQVMDFALESA